MGTSLDREAATIKIKDALTIQDSMVVKQNAQIDQAATGTFLSLDGKVVTVIKGIVISIT